MSQIRNHSTTTDTTSDNTTTERQIIDELADKYDPKMIYVLWLIKKYKIPYKSWMIQQETKEEDVDSLLDKKHNVIDETAFMMKGIYNIDPYNKNKNSDESLYAEFIRKTVDKDIFDEHDDHITSQYDAFLDKQTEKAKTEAAQLVAQYICDCLMFDRGIPNKGKYYWDAAKDFIEDIDEKAQYNLKQTSAFWSLLCNLAASYEEIDNISNEQKYVDEVIKYINRAFEVREQMYGKKDADKYFESEAYAIDLNNIGYTLLNLDRRENQPVEFAGYEKLVRKIYDEIYRFLQTASNLRWKSLVISNMGAIAGRYGSHIDAVRYDLQALSLKQSLLWDAQEKSLKPKRDISLTTLKSHLNIVNNSLEALFELQFKYAKKSNALIPPSKLNEYISLIGTHAIEAFRLRKQIDDEISVSVSDLKERKKQEGYPGKEECGLRLKRATKRAIKWLEENYDDINRKKDGKGQSEDMTGPEVNNYQELLKSQKEYMQGVDNYLTSAFEEYKGADVSNIKTKEVTIKIVRY